MEVGRRQNEDGELTKRLHQQVSAAADELKELAAVHTKLELHKAKRIYWMKR